MSKKLTAIILMLLTPLAIIAGVITVQDIPDTTIQTDVITPISWDDVFKDENGNTPVFITFEIDGQSIYSVSWAAISGTNFLFNPGAAEIGAHTVSMTTQDLNGGYASSSFNLTIQVAPPTVPPTVNLPTPDTTIETDAASVIDTSKLFTDGGGVTAYSVVTYCNGVSLPTWMTYDNVQQALLLNPLGGDEGTYNMEFRATDLNNNVVSDFFVLGVETAVPPVIVPTEEKIQATIDILIQVAVDHGNVSFKRAGRALDRLFNQGLLEDDYYRIDYYGHLLDSQYLDDDLMNERPDWRYISIEYKRGQRGGMNDMVFHLGVIAKNMPILRAEAIAYLTSTTFFELSDANKLLYKGWCEYMDSWLDVPGGLLEQATALAKSEIDDIKEALIDADAALPVAQQKYPEYHKNWPILEHLCDLIFAYSDKSGLSRAINKARLEYIRYNGGSAQVKADLLKFWRSLQRAKKSKVHHKSIVTKQLFTICADAKKDAENVVGSKAECVKELRKYIADIVYEKKRYQENDQTFAETKTNIDAIIAAMEVKKTALGL